MPEMKMSISEKRNGIRPVASADGGVHEGPGFPRSGTEQVTGVSTMSPTHLPRGCRPRRGAMLDLRAPGFRQERGVVQQGDICARTRGQTECLARGGGGCTQSARPEQRSAHGGQAPKEAGRSKRHTMRCGRPVSRRLGAGSGAVAHRPCGAMTRHFSLRGRALDQESNRCPVAHRPSRSGPIDLRVRRMENHRFKSDTHSNIGDRSKCGNSSLHTRAGLSRGTQCSGSGVSGHARARQRPGVSSASARADNRAA